MKKIIAATAMALVLSGCGVNPDSAKRALEAQGITNVKIEGWSAWGCSEGDKFRSKFSGTGSNGKPVTGVVCSGLFKGVTVRFD